MKKLLCTIVFLFAANYARAQNYFTTTTSATNSNSNLSHFGTFTLGSTFENLNDPWRTGEGRLLELYKPSGNVSFRLGNAFGKLSFNIAGHNGAFFPSAQQGDIVIRKHTADKVYFSLNTSGGTGDSAFIFGDATNRQTLSILNNGKVGIGTTSPSTKLHVSSSTSGDAVLKLEADTDNNNEGDNARIELLQDGNSLGAIIGFNQDFAANSDPGNLFRIATRFSNVNATDTFVINMQNKNIGIGTTNPDEKLTVKGKIHAEEVKIDLNVPPDYVFQKYYTGVSLLKDTYKMPTLKEVEEFTKKNHHLPEVPSAKEIKKNGFHLKQMTALLLQKVEELTLYTIEQEKLLKKQGKRIEGLEQKLTDNKI